jgi:AmpD protein
MATQSNNSGLPVATIIDGWLCNARRIPSPNCGPRPDATIDLLVIHNISLPPGQFGGPYIDALFQNCLNPQEHSYFQEICQLQVSAHLLIDRCGHISQYVSFDDRAWHAGESSFRGVDNCNDFSIGIELEGCDEQVFTDQQYRSLVEVTGLIRAAYPAITADRIVGHSDIAPGRKTDPGPLFAWCHYLDAIDR